MPRYEGRLELTWTNKHERLLADADGSYEWLSPTDYRVAEVRLLSDAGSVGDVGGSRSATNLLITGDALYALTSLARLPELATEYAGKVRLAYLDPPFNTQQSFLQYDDALDHSVWLTMIRDRLDQIRALLHPELGSVWVHCDDSEQHRLRCVLDEVFGPSSWVTTIVWQKRTSRDNRAAFSPSHDYIHVYAPAGPQKWKEHRNPLAGGGGYSNPDSDPEGPWRSIPMSAQAGHATASQFYDVVTPTGLIQSPPKGRARTYARDRFEGFVAEGRVYWPRGGNGRPRLKRYQWEETGLVPFTLWPADEVGENSDAKKEILTLFPDHPAFATPKPERLLQRIVQSR